MAKNMTKRLIALFVCVTMIVTLLLTGVNFVVDPFNFFRWNSGISKDPGRHADANRRTRALCMLKNAPSDTYQGIILGGSKSWPVSEELLKTYTGKNWLSCSFSGGYFETYETIIRYGLEHQQLEDVILYLSGYEIYGGVTKAEYCRVPDFAQSGSEITDILYYLFAGFENSIDKLADGTAPSLTSRFTECVKNYDPFDEENLQTTYNMGFSEDMEIDESALRLITSRVQAVKVSGYDYYYSSAYSKNLKDQWIDHAVLNQDAPYNECLRKLFCERKYLPNKQSNIVHLKNIIELCKEYDVELTVILGATFITERKAYEGIEYWDYMREVAELTDFYDFSYFCDINKNPYNFYDTRHHLDFVSCIMLDNIYGEGVIPFGQKVTAENFSEYIAQREADYFALEREYRETGTIQLEELGSESDLSSLPSEFWLELLDRSGKNAA